MSAKIKEPTLTYCKKKPTLVMRGPLISLILEVLELLKFQYFGFKRIKTD